MSLPLAGRAQFPQWGRSPRRVYGILLGYSPLPPTISHTSPSSHPSGLPPSIPPSFHLHPIYIWDERKDLG